MFDLKLTWKIFLKLLLECVASSNGGGIAASATYHWFVRQNPNPALSLSNLTFNQLQIHKINLTRMRLAWSTSTYALNRINIRVVAEMQQHPQSQNGIFYLRRNCRVDWQNGALNLSLYKCPPDALARCFQLHVVNQRTQINHFYKHPSFSYSTRHLFMLPWKSLLKRVAAQIHSVIMTDPQSRMHQSLIWRPFSEPLNDI